MNVRKGFIVLSTVSQVVNIRFGYLSLIFRLVYFVLCFVSALSPYILNIL